MSSSSDIEHWPEDDALYTRPAVPAPGYDSNNGLNHHTYNPPPSPPPKSDKSAPRDPPPAPSQIVYPQPVYYAQHPAHMMPQQPQYYSHGQAVYAMPSGQPQPVYYAAPPAGAPPAPQYYTYATAPAPFPAPAPVTAPAKSANFHVYQPMTEKSEKAGAADGNLWFGRTKQQVEEDNMKIAKKEGAYDKRKIAPVVEDENQIFWVCETDGSQTLRDFRYIKTIAGDWKKDPRWPDAYYFVVAKEEPEGK